MKHGSLFSGIGGPDLAAEKMGWENVFHCEINPFGQKVLKYYWPTAISYEDIKKTDFSIHRGTIDVLTGGFPCQPYSLAGLRKGKEDERHLWPEMLRSIREIKPRWIVGENVLGLVGWNDGLVFEEVQTDLEAEGYEVQPYVLPAAGVDAPHQRYRVWFVAYASGNGHQSGKSGKNRRAARESQSHRYERKRIRDDYRRVSEPGYASDTTGKGLPISRQTGFSELSEKNIKGMDDRSKFCSSLIANSNNEGLEVEQCQSNYNGEEQQAAERSNDQWSVWPTQSPVCNGDDGISTRLDSITFSKWRTESIKAGGNAIVHQVILQIFKAIEMYEKNINI